MVQNGNNIVVNIFGQSFQLKTAELNFETNGMSRISDLTGHMTMFFVCYICLSIIFYIIITITIIIIIIIIILILILIITVIIMIIIVKIIKIFGIIICNNSNSD